MARWLNVMTRVLDERLRANARRGDAARHAVVFAVIVLTSSLSNVCLAAANAESSTVVYSSIASGTLYYCGPDAMAGDEPDRNVAIAKIELGGSNERTDFIVPVRQNFTRHPFRWRVADEALFFLTGTNSHLFMTARQDNFILHRIPLLELPKHRREALRLPRRQDFTDYAAYEKAWFLAVGRPAETGKPGLFGPYLICTPMPLVWAFIFSDELKSFSYDLSLSTLPDTKCFTYSKGLLKESVAKLTKIEAAAAASRRDPELWQAVRSHKIVLDERFWVFGSKSLYYLVTESGKVLIDKAPDEPRALEAFAESPIVCIVDDADSGRVFAFSRRAYCELNHPLKLTAHELTVQDGDCDPVSLAARCARILFDAGRMRLLETKRVEGEKN